MTRTSLFQTAVTVTVTVTVTVGRTTAAKKRLLTTAPKATLAMTMTIMTRRMMIR